MTEARNILSSPAAPAVKAAAAPNTVAKVLAATLASTPGAETYQNTATRFDDARVKIFRLQVEQAGDFQTYTNLYRRAGRNQFDHNIYFKSSVEEELFNAVREGLVPDNLTSVGQVIAYLMLHGIAALRNPVR